MARLLALSAIGSGLLLFAAGWTGFTAPGTRTHDAIGWAAVVVTASVLLGMAAWLGRAAARVRATAAARGLPAWMPAAADRNLGRMTRLILFAIASLPLAGVTGQTVSPLAHLAMSSFSLGLSVGVLVLGAVSVASQDHHVREADSGGRH